MAWTDFIKAIQQGADDEKKKVGRWFDDRGEDIKKGTRDFLNTKVDMPDWWDHVENFDKNVATPVLEKSSNFVTDTLQAIPRGVVNTYLTLDEAGRNNDIDGRNKTIDEIKKISKADRDKYGNMSREEIDKLPPEEFSKAFTLRRAKEQLGDLSDESLEKRRKENETEKGTHKTYKAGNGFTKFLVGGEDDEVAQSAQKTTQDAEGFLNKNGIQGPAAAFLAPAAGTLNAALDIPTGVGSLVKGVGKGAIKQMAKEGGEEAIEQILRGQLPKAGDDLIKSLVPQLAKATDEKAVKDILVQGGRGAIKPLAAPFKSAEATLRGTVDDIAAAPGSVKDFASNLFSKSDKKKTLATSDDILESANTALPDTPTPPIVPQKNKVTGYGSATDELLGNIRYGSELPNPKGTIKEQVKQQWWDKLSPVNDFVKTAEEKMGRTLTTEENPYQLMRLYQGMPDRVKNRVTEITDVLKQSDDLNAVKAIGMARQIIDRGAEAIDDAGDVIKGKGSTITVDKARAVLDEQRARLGVEGFDKAATIVDSVTKYNRGLLDDLHEAGIVGDDAFKAIVDTGADYFSKFNVIEHIMKNDANRQAFATGSYNNTVQSLKKVLAESRGHKEGALLLDPIESLVKSTDSTMRLVAKNNIWDSFNKLADEVPDLVTRVKDPENIAERIKLSLDSQELRPVRDKLDSMMKTRGGWVRKLESQINQLEKKGMATSLKEGGERMTNQAFDVAGLGGKVPTSQTGKLTKEVSTPNLIGEMVDAVRQGSTKVGNVNPSMLGPSDTQAFLRNLIENGSRSTIDKYKRMVGTRDANMTKILDEIGEMKSQFDDVAGKIKDNTGKIRGELADADVPEGMELISGFGKGLQGKLAVPKEVADVFTGKNKLERDQLTGLMGTVNGFVKRNLTSNNPTFALITNPIRDAKTFAYNAQDVKANPFSIGKALVGGFAERIKKGDQFERWVEAGGKSGYYADERMGEDIAKDIAKEFTGKRSILSLGVKVQPVNNAKDFVREFARVVSTPVRAPLQKGIDMLHGAASVLEDTPRVAQFQASLKAGKTDAAAAFNARNVTVDFQQSGQYGQVLNAWIPFLNARAQGTLKTAEAIKNNPARAAAVYAGLTATPIILQTMINSQFPDVMKNIPDDTRDNNFLLVFGDGKDEQGNYNQVIKIPKADVDKVLGNPLENFMRFLQDDDPKSFGQVVTEMVGGVLPVDVTKDGELSASRAVGSALPPILKAPVEAVTNKSLYFDAPLVPDSMKDLPNNEQVRRDDPNTEKKERSTNPIAEFIANLTGGSPIKTENTLRNFTGNQLNNPADTISGKLSGASANKSANEFYKINNDVKKQTNSVNRQVNEMISSGNYAEAQRLAQEHNTYVKTQFTPWVSSYRDQITPEMETAFLDNVISLTPRSIKQRQRNQLERKAAQ